MNRNKLAVPAFLFCALAPALAAQDPEIISTVGQPPLFGCYPGALVSLPEVAGSNLGAHVHATTPGTPLADEGIYFQGQFCSFKDGTPVSSNLSATGVYLGDIKSISDFDVAPAATSFSFIVELDINGQSAGNWVCFNTVGLIRSGSALAGNPSFLYRQLSSTQINGSGQILLGCTLDDPVFLPDTSAIVRLKADSLSGLISSDIVAWKGDTLPGGVVRRVGLRESQIALNELGESMFSASLQNGSAIYTTVGGAVTLVAQESGSAPLPGDIFSNLYEAPLDMNDSGQFAFAASLVPGGVRLLVTGDSSGQLKEFIRTGDQMQDPALQGMTLELLNGSRNPIYVTPQGNVVWWGNWNDVTTQDEGLFINHRLLVQEGVTEIDPGTTLTSVHRLEKDYHVSANGRYLVFRGLASTDEVAMQIDFGVEVIAGCDPSKGTLTHIAGPSGMGGLPYLGETVTLWAEGGTAGQLVTFKASLVAPTLDASGCGIQFPWGELLIGLPDNFTRTFAYNGSPKALSFTIPNDPTLLGLESYMQAGFSGGGTVTMTNALKLVIANAQL